MTSYTSEQIATIADKIKSVKFGMFTTSDDTRTLTSRPLTQQQIDSEGQIWFFVTDEAAYTRDLLNNPASERQLCRAGRQPVCLGLRPCRIAEGPRQGGRTVEPHRQGLVPGRPRRSPPVLIKVTIQSAEYWDSDASKMRQFFEMAKAAITGDTPKDLGEHGRIDL